MTDREERHSFPELTLSIPCAEQKHNLLTDKRFSLKVLRRTLCVVPLGKIQPRRDRAGSESRIQTAPIVRTPWQRSV